MYVWNIYGQYGLSDCRNTLYLFTATDSEESEFSSLEREKRDMYSKVNRKPTPHKKKHRHHRNQEKLHEKFVTQVYHDPRQTDHDRLQGMEAGDRGLSACYITHHLT